MAAPQAQSWKDLPTACLHEIFARIPCAEDRHRAYRACPAWLRALRDLQPPPAASALPWLLVPAPNPNGSTRLVCVLSGCCVHQDHHYAAVIPRGARCFGSHDGAWLFLATHDDDPHGHQLLNVRTGAILQLPGDMEMVQGLNLYSLGLRLPITIHAAALSAAPDEEGCVAVSIVTANDGPDSIRSVARWRMGQQRACEILPPGLHLHHSFLDAEDVVYHDGAFHLLLRDSDGTAVYTPEVLPDWQIRFFSQPGASNYGDDQGVRARYLVSSRDQLLLVVRFASRPNERTSKFMVFLATESPPHQMPDDEAYPVFPDDDAAYPWTWSVMGPLADRILFVGHGFSRSYELDEYEGYNFKAGIYFLDDGMFFEEEPEMYPCSDNGWWSDSDGAVHHCFTQGDPSCNSPPAWLLP